MTAPFSAAVAEIVGAAGGFPPPPRTLFPALPPPHAHIMAVDKTITAGVVTPVRMCKSPLRESRSRRPYLTARKSRRQTRLRHPSMGMT
jgi:hypothetical protein